METAMRTAWKDTDIKQKWFLMPLALATASAAGGKRKDTADGDHPAPKYTKAQRRAYHEAQMAARAAGKAAGAPPPQPAIKGGGKGNGKQKGQPQRKLMEKTPDGQRICFKFGKGKCQVRDCKFLHACRLCGVEGHAHTACPTA